jgi:hypothetical protein
MFVLHALLHRLYTLHKQWNLAERYTDVLKTLFVGLFYSAILPTGLIITVIAMVSGTPTMHCASTLPYLCNFICAGFT